jgi:hypothetical protein
MKKIFLFGISLLLFSCNDKEIQLPKLGVTIVADVRDHSPVYFFFTIKEKDTLAEVNRKNTISTTNWLFNIDKKLPLHIVMPEVIKLQKKKKSGMHKSDTAENFYTYADTITKKMAFFPFEKIIYKLKKPIQGNLLKFDKRNTIIFEGKPVLLQDLALRLNFYKGVVQLCFAKELTFGDYLKNKSMLYNLNFLTFSQEECIY